MKITIIDASRRQAEAAVRALAGIGHACETYARATAFFAQGHPETCNLLLLDAHPTDVGAQEVLVQVRAQPGMRLPVLLLADATDIETVVASLAAGADDYLLRPLRQAELLARVQVLLRRAWPERVASSQLRFGAYLFDQPAMRLTVNGRWIDLTQKEFQLALLFFRHAGQPLSRTTILEAIWGQGREASFRSIDTHVSRVRSKLHLQPANGFRLVPVYGFGYLLQTVAT